MNTTLVTGSTGLVGYPIVQTLLRRGRRVRALVRSLEKGRRVLPAGCELAQGDINDRGSVLRALEGCDVVYHAAGLSEQWLPDPALFQRVNVDGTRTVLEAALEGGVRRFVFTSTIDVFECAPGAGFDESRLDPLPRNTYYQRSKQSADRIVAEAAQRGVNAVFIHPAAVYGPGPAGSPGINALIRQMQHGGPPALPPGGVGLVYAPDLGEGHVLSEEQAPPGSRYILSECYVTLAELARAVYAVMGMTRNPPPPMPLWFGRLLAGMGKWAARITHKSPLLDEGELEFLLWQARPSSAKAQRELGWKPTPLAEGLADMLRGEKDIK